jgi:hypothetical protein
MDGFIVHVTDECNGSNVGIERRDSMSVAVDSRERLPPSQLKTQRQSAGASEDVDHRSRLPQSPRNLETQNRRNRIAYLLADCPLWALENETIGKALEPRRLPMGKSPMLAAFEIIVEEATISRTIVVCVDRVSWPIRM